MAQINKFLLLGFAFLILFSGILDARDITLYGYNYFTYSMRDTSSEDFVYNKLNLIFNYGDYIILGTTAELKLPKEPEIGNSVYDLEDTKFDITKAFLQYQTESAEIIAGTFYKQFGNGLNLNLFEDAVLDEDNYLEGLSGTLRLGRNSLSFLTGKHEDDIVRGAELGLSLTDNLQISGNIVKSILKQNNSEYKNSWRKGIHLNLLLGSYSLISEYVWLGSDQYGIYSALQGDVGDFSWLIDGKLYKDIYYPYMSPPTVNYTGDALADELPVGEDEIGAQLVLYYYGLENHSFKMNLNSAWSEDEVYKMNEFFIHDEISIGSNLLTLYYEQQEKIDENRQTYNDPKKWEKYYKGGIKYDFYIYDIPLSTTIEDKYNHKKDQGINENYTEIYNEPTVLLELNPDWLSISVNLTAKIRLGETELTEDNFFPSISLSRDISDNTRVILFAGKEKGGKTCSNGICKYKNPFSGLRAEVNIDF